MKRRISRFATSGILTVALAACGGSTSPKPSVSGAWVGSFGQNIVTMNLAQQGGTVTGSARISGFGGDNPYTVSGTFSAPTVTLALTATNGTPNGGFSATFTGSSLAGTLTGAEYNPSSLTLTRQ